MSELNFYWRMGDYALANYCMNCGFRILWDSPRCLTGHDSPKEEGGAK